MNCNKNNDSKKHNGFKHILHMILCCGLPILIIGALPFIRSLNPTTASFLGVIAPFICPIMMILMAIFMFKKDGSSCCKNKPSSDN